MRILNQGTIQSLLIFSVSFVTAFASLEGLSKGQIA